MSPFWGVLWRWYDTRLVYGLLRRVGGARLASVVVREDDRFEGNEDSMTTVQGEPMLVTRRGAYKSWGGGMGYHETVEVADFSGEDRPAYRVACHCRNCSWKGEARVRVGEKLPLWLHCPKCETYELSAHGDFKGRDDLTREEEDVQFREAYERSEEMRAKVMEAERRSRA